MTTTTMLKDFQSDAVGQMTELIDGTTDNLAILLDCPTAGGKTLMLIATMDAVSQPTKSAWFWFAPFKGLVEQTRKVISNEGKSLLVRDVRLDRRASSVKTGDVFVMTWATVARADPEGSLVRNGLIEMMPSIDQMVEALREDGFRIGCVVDEEHVHLREDNEALVFCQQVLRPDVILLATATPNKQALVPICQALGVTENNFHHVAVDREAVVDARLNKRGIRSMLFQADHNADNALIDVHEKAIEMATTRHYKIKSRLKHLKLPITPLLLVQVANQRRRQGEGNTVRPTDAAKTLLLKHGFTEQQIAVHTADEPDAELLALAEDATKEVLIFKTAIATGFDLPRAWTLAALRDVVDKDFGLQIVGRTMRVHPLIQPLELPVDSDLEYAHVVLAASNQQRGLNNALRPIPREDLQKWVAAELMKLSGRPTPWIEVPGGNDPGGENPGPGGNDPGGENPGPGGNDPGDENPGPDGNDPGQAEPPEFRYPLCAGMPTVFLTDYSQVEDDDQTLATRIITDMKDKLWDGDIANALIKKKISGHVIERQHISAGDGEQYDRIRDSAVLDRSRHRIRATNLLKELSLSEPLILDGISNMVREYAKNQSIDALAETEVLNTVFLLISSKPELIKNAYNTIVANSIASRNASPLPDLIQEHKSAPAKKNIYGVFPAGLNSWERQLAESLDNDPRVIWWHRNQSRKDYSVAIIRAPNRNKFFPDFVVMVKGRKKGGGIVLLDPHERQDEDAKSKVRSEHTAYGKPYLLKLVNGDSFHVVGYNQANDAIALGGPFDLNQVME